VARLYGSRGARLDESRIFLTASTSEAYAHLFRLLCDPGDEVLAPAPSYPLFDLLAGISDISLRHYPLLEEEGFRIDMEALARAVGERCRALLLVNPGNPTGTFLQTGEREGLLALCRERDLAVICDEVFGDFAFQEGGRPGRVRTLAGEEGALTFVLDGISKMLALPQLKLGWIAASGPGDQVEEAIGRLEVISDTFLSVNTPVQVALPELLSMKGRTQERIRARLDANRALLEEVLATPHPARPLSLEAGWSAVIRAPSICSDEEWALALLERDGVLVHPGFFFDFPSEGRLVVSLLPEEGTFREGIRRVASRLGRT
jgi:aspartate/methionine/tyrosine aminotransferase